ncbi:hypothetical protein ACMZ5F_28830 [Streptomyces rhizosphaericola]|uniref:hypothetical protein n=1 Tax=Streptomyces rhizosphaericola TaxID=2564098 RepID=UPI0039F0B8F0
MELSKAETAEAGTADDVYTLTFTGWEAETLVRELAAVPRAKRTILGDLASGLLRDAAVEAGHTVRTRRGAPAGRRT